MNLIDYNNVIDALEKERQFLHNREQYGAEHVLVHHAINVIDELPIIRQPEIVRCKNCDRRGTYDCPIYVGGYGDHGSPDDWFCADGKRKEGRSGND